jgi:predicted TIM-barrel fold metal-dependent hydrolase
MDAHKLPILDCHQHFYDARRLRYPLFVERSAGFESLVGDYGALPRVYLPRDYARDVSGLDVVKTVWAEFLSDDPIGEVRFAQELAHATGRAPWHDRPGGVPKPEIEATLNFYASMDRVRCVRQHLGWHPTNSLLRYAPRPDLLSDDAWRRGLLALSNRDLCGELEIFAPQLPDLAAAVASCPDIQFVLPLMGWPVDLTSDGHRAWKRALATVAACENVAVKIFGMECIFGIHWTVPQVRPWILDTIELFGPDRCMFASHTPLCKLACSVQQLYGAYLEIIADFSSSEKRQLLHDTAATVYAL